MFPVVGVSDGVLQSSDPDGKESLGAPVDGEAISPPPAPKQHYFRRGTSFIQKKGYWIAPCPHCDAEIADTTPRKVSKTRQNHLRRWHPGLPKIGNHSKTPPLENVPPEDAILLWKCPIVGCNAGVRDKGVTYSSKTLSKATDQHRAAMHPRVSAKAYRIKQINAYKATPAMRQSKRVENLNASAAANLSELTKLGLTLVLIPVVRRNRTTKKCKLVLARHWLCTGCSVLGEGLSRAPNHECARTRRASDFQHHLKVLRQTKQWCAKHPDHGVPQDDLDRIFEEARRVLRGASSVSS